MQNLLVLARLDEGVEELPASDFSMSRLLEEERTQAVRDNEEDIPWIRLFRQYENITELHRHVLVNLVEKIVIYDAQHVEVFFRYQDKFEKALQYIRRMDGMKEEA